MESREFFSEVFGKGQGWAVLVTPNRHGKPTNDAWFRYPEQLDQMVAHTEANAHTDVWFSPNLFESQSRTKETSKTTQTAAADADICHPNNFRVQPSITVQTSPGRYHVYWLLNATKDPHEVAKLNRRIAQVHKDEGCDTAFVNAAKLLRVPGTSNGKHPGAVVVVIDDEADRHTIAKLNKAYPESEIPDAVEAAPWPDMPDGLAEFIENNRHGLLNGLPNTTTLRDLLFKEPHEGKRSEARFKLLCELADMGLSDEEVMAVAWGAPSNKYRDDPRKYKGLWDELQKAKQTMAAEAAKYDLPVGEWDGDSEDGRPKKIERKRTSFIKSDAEHEMVRAQVNFIDRWVTWAGTKTDAPSEYHRASAMSVLSTVYSEFGHAIPKFAPKGMKLNLWFMVLGRSTKDRKTTARNYMNDALRALRDDELGYNYLLGDDVTPGGISLALHDRAHQASVYARDEAQGLFKELMSQSYMTGGLEVFTKLYDGWSGGRLRASGDKKVMESVPVSFIMLLTGILTEVTQVLTVTNYRSGFLTRFLYVVGERPDDYEAPPVEQASEEDEKKDEVFDALIEHLRKNRNYWEMYGGHGDTHPLRVEDDAWARFQVYEKDVNSAANDSKYAEIIGTTSERMIISTLKLACLLAMDDKAMRVSMVHMLQAIAYAGEWFDNAARVASMISESEWQRDVDLLEDYIISRGGTVQYGSAYKQFPDKRPNEFEEMVGALQSRGTLERIKQGAKWVLAIVEDN